MSLRNGIIAFIMAAIMQSPVSAGSAFARLSCSDITYSNPDYHEKMDVLAERARLPDNYRNRYHEDLVRDMCSGNIKGVDELVDAGYVTPREALDIARVLGKAYKAKPRTETGKRFGYSREKLLEMGACSACADNIAQYYATQPDSRCGKLAKQALAGNPDAVRKVVAFPDYCQRK